LGDKEMKEQSVARGTAVLSVAGILVKIISLLYLPFLIAVIGDVGNGIYAAAYQVYVFVYVLTNSGIPVAISKLVSELIAVGNRKDAVRSFKIARFLLIIAGFTMSLLMFVLASPLADMVNSSRSYLAIMALAPSLLFTSVASSYRGYFQGCGNMTPTAVSQIVEQIINAVFTVMFAALLLGVGLEEACAGGTIGTTLGALFSAGLLVVFYKKSNRHKVPDSPDNLIVKRYSYSQLVKKIINYSIPITLCVGLQYAGNLVDLANTLGRLGVAGYIEDEASKLYSQLYKYQQLLNAPLAVMIALSTTILPVISAAVTVKDRAKVLDRSNFAFKMCFLITVPSAVGMAVLSTPIYDILKYHEGAYLMKYGAIVLVLLALVQIQTAILQGAGRLYAVSINLILGLVGKITANYFLIAIPEVNINGAIIGSIVGFCIPIVLNNMLMERVLKVKLNMKAFFVKPLVAALAMGVIVYFTYYSVEIVLFFALGSYLVNAIAVLTSTLTGAVAYFLILVLIKGISRADLDMLPRKVLKLIPSSVMNRIS
jgi:stage V sporulation protein B